MFLRKKNGSFLQFFKRKEESTIFNFDRNGTRPTTAIGIIGCDFGTGVTHLALSLCSYCASKCRKRTAFVELHARNEISHLIPESEILPAMTASAKCKIPYPHFTLYGADYYPKLSGEALPALLNQGYDYLILDLGNVLEADISEFLRCDRKVVIGSAMPWKLWKYEQFFQKFENSINLQERFCYLVTTGTKKEIQRISKLHRIAMLRVPFIKDPFRIGKELFLFFAALLADT